jgi:hypothetical protein
MMAFGVVSRRAAEPLARGSVSALLACLLLCTSLVVSVSPALASTWRVPEDFSTIREALNVAQPCDVVYVGPGTYAETLFVSEGVRLIADGGPGEVVVQPERDGAGSPAAEVAILTNGSTIEGFTLRDAIIGVSITGLWSEVRNNIILDVEVGISAQGAEGWLVGNQISYPSTRGVHGNGASLWIDDTLIEGADQGIDLVSSFARLLNDELRGNVRGVSLQDSIADIASTTFVDNQTAAMLSLGDVVVQGSTFSGNIVGLYLVDSPAQVLDNDFSGNDYGLVTEFSAPIVVANHFDFSSLEAISEGIGSASLIANNLFTDNSESVVSTVADPHIHNNDFVGGNRGVVISGGDVRVLNNAFSSLLEVGLDGSNAVQLVAGHNLFWDNVSDELGGALNGSELFVDPMYDGNYRPMQGSPLVDAGSQDPNYADPDGTRSDIGRSGGPYRDDGYNPPAQGTLSFDEQPEYEVDEGDELVIFAQGVHVSNNDPVRFNWDVDAGDDLEFCDSFTGAVTFNAPDDGTYHLRVRARDTQDNEATQDVIVQVRNTDPFLDWRFLGDSPVEGGFIVVWADAWDMSPLDEVYVSVDFESDGIIDIENHDVAKGPLVQLWALPQSGTWMSTLWAFDDDGGVMEVGEELEVANLPPYLSDDPPELVRVGQTLGWVVAAEDPSPLDEVYVSLVAGPAGMTVEGGVLEWTPTEAGFYDYGLLLTDSDGASATFSHQIEVLESLEEGCGCSAVASRRTGLGVLWAFLALAFARARRRTTLRKA